MSETVIIKSSEIYTNFIQNPYSEKIFTLRIRFNDKANIKKIFIDLGLPLRTNLSDDLNAKKSFITAHGKHFGWFSSFLINYFDGNQVEVHSISREELIGLKDTLLKSSPEKAFFIDGEPLENPDPILQYIFSYFILREYNKGKEIEFHDRVRHAIRAVEDYNVQNDIRFAYFAGYTICTLTEEIIFRIARTKGKGILLRERNSISDNLDILQAHRTILCEHPDDKPPDAQGFKQLKIIEENTNTKKVFDKKNGGDMLALNSIRKINEIRPLFAHYGVKGPDIPEDVLQLVFYFGQLLIWCEKNGCV